VTLRLTGADLKPFSGPSRERVSCRTGDKGSALINPGRLAITNANTAICAASGDEKSIS